MGRVVLDVNVFVAALLSPRGAPAQVLQHWTDGGYELVVSPLLLAELERVMRRPKFRGSIEEAEITGLLDALIEDASVVRDPPADPGLTPDPGDDYLVSLARAAAAECIVSGDAHLIELHDPRPPVLAPRAFLARSESR
jgi:putative PIN family toxin of toxin-antitoxin system